jgi:ABC-type thiamine transport system ATPase subunit
MNKVSDEKIANGSRHVGADGHRFQRALPQDRYAFGGEKQRVAIAKAIVQRLPAFA